MTALFEFGGPSVYQLSPLLYNILQLCIFVSKLLI